MFNLQTFLAATAFKFIQTIFALNKQQMTSDVFAVAMRVRFLAALMAIANDFLRDLLAQTIIENEIFAFEFIFQILLFDLPHIFDNSAFEMKNLCKTVVQQIRARLFAANPAGAIHNYIAVFFIFEHLDRHRQLLAESVA